MCYLLVLFSFMTCVTHASEGDVFIPVVGACESQTEEPSAALLQFASMESMLIPDTLETKSVLIESAIRCLKRKRDADAQAAAARFMVMHDNLQRVHVRGAQQMLNNLDGIDFFMQALTDCSAVFQVDLSQNVLKSPLPAHCLASFRYLKKLNVSHNQLTEIPDLRCLGMLEYFNGSHNKISSMNLLGNFPAGTLKYIDLGDNQIEAIEDVGKWRMAPQGLIASKVRGYYVCTVALFDRNKISSFPETLGGIGGLNVLCLGLSGNPIREDSLPDKARGNAFLGGGCVDLRGTLVITRRAKELQKDWNIYQADSARITILYGEGGNTQMNKRRSIWPTYLHDEQPMLSAQKKKLIIGNTQ